MQAELDRWQPPAKRRRGVEEKKFTVTIQCEDESQVQAAQDLIGVIYQDAVPQVKTADELCHLVKILLLADCYRVTSSVFQPLCKQLKEAPADALTPAFWRLLERCPSGMLDRGGALEGFLVHARVRVVSAVHFTRSVCVCHEHIASLSHHAGHPEDPAHHTFSGVCVEDQAEERHLPGAASSRSARRPAGGIVPSA
jgi:hypothetical protein